MNNQDYEHKKKACWLQFCREKGVDQEVNISIYEAFDSIFDCAYALGKQTETITQEEIGKEAEHYEDKHTEQLIYDIQNDRTSWKPLQDGICNAFKAGANFALGKQEKDADTVIQGWVARDKNGDLVCCAGSKPFKEEKLPFWRVDFRNFIECIPNDLFPDLTWDSDPIEVELIIKRKNNGNIQ